MSEEHEAGTWIITGASSGLGLALAEAALEAGEQVGESGACPGLPVAVRGFQPADQ